MLRKGIEIQQFCWWAPKLTSPQNRNIPFIPMDQRWSYWKFLHILFCDLRCSCIRWTGLWHSNDVFFISDFSKKTDLFFVDMTLRYQLLLHQ